MIAKVLRKLDRWGYRLSYGLVAPLNVVLSRLVRLRPPDPQRLRVAHVSVQSTKPFIKTRVLRDLGVQADYIVPRGRGWLKVEEPGCDRYLGMDGLPWLVRPFFECYFFWRYMIHYDIYHIHFLTSFSESMWDIGYLKRLGKKVVFHFRGCDIRDEATNHRKHPTLNTCQECTYDREFCSGSMIRMKRELARAHGDLFLVTTPDLLDFIPEASHLPFMNVSVDPAALPDLERDRSMIRIVHATNHEGIDGTRFITEAVEVLKAEGYPIDFVSAKRISNKDVLTLYKSADICVGKLRQGYYSNFQIESMALGKPTLCYLRREFLDQLPGIPIVNTTPVTVYENLKALLDDPERRRVLGERGMAFVRAMHSNRRVGETLLAMYRSLLGAEAASERSATGVENMTEGFSGPEVSRTPFHEPASGRASVPAIVKEPDRDGGPSGNQMRAESCGNEGDRRLYLSIGMMEGPR